MQKRFDTSQIPIFVIRLQIFILVVRMFECISSGSTTNWPSRSRLVREVADRSQKLADIPVVSVIDQPGRRAQWKILLYSMFSWDSYNYK